MFPASGSQLPLVILALGIIAVILSFLVADRKKSLIALGLAGLILVTGLWQLGSQTIRQYSWERRMKSIQRDRQTDLDDLRQRLRDKSDEPASLPGGTINSNTKKK